MTKFETRKHDAPALATLGGRDERTSSGARPIRRMNLYFVAPSVSPASNQRLQRAYGCYPIGMANDVIQKQYWTSSEMRTKLIARVTRAERESMAAEQTSTKKPPGRVTVPTENKLLVGRTEAAEMLSISCRALDYLVANGKIRTRRIGARVLIPMADLLRFCEADHPHKLVG